MAIANCAPIYNLFVCFAVAAFVLLFRQVFPSDHNKRNKYLIINLFRLFRNLFMFFFYFILKH